MAMTPQDAHGLHPVFGVPVYAFLSVFCFVMSQVGTDGAFMPETLQQWFSLAASVIFFAAGAVRLYKELKGGRKG